MRTLLSTLLLAPLLVLTAACEGSGGVDQSDLPPQNRVAERYHVSLDVQLDSMTRRSNGLYYQDVAVGEGARVDSGDVVTVHYTGWLPNGNVFDSSRDGEPFEVAIGYGRVIDGWDQGVVGMREGGQRRLVIPPALGYGDQARGPIPSNSTLVFDVEVVELENRVEGGEAVDTTTG
jgi:peptidylprolyl isomerase